ncbi:hypothetical protein CFC21_015646 [Triticum aestivum]|uniref:Protein kinase domain-containing protein n=2 Tax=Triticum aestivum TaxID=4565 RepID=A0A9R1DXF2_WHEAT|nr:hypothetical protein CFC21_015646 [Triticum aestivum]
MTTTRSSQSHNSQPLPIILVLLAAAAAASTPLILQVAAAAAEQDEKQPITLPGCPDRCGDTLIPFPFGTKPGCFREGFQVTCNDSFTPHRAFLAYAGVNQHIAEIYYKVGWHHPVWRTDHGNTALELIDISVADGEARAYGLVSSLCNAANLSGDYVAKCQNLALGERGPFLLSVTRNLLVGVGWRVEPKIMSYLWSAYRNSTYEFSLACLSDLMGMPKLLQLATNGSCSSRGCCQAALPEAAPLTDFGTWFTIEDNPMWQTNPCTYAMVVESDWYRFSTRRTCTASRCCPGGTRGASPSCSTSPSGTVHARGKARNHLRTTPASAATAIVPTRLVVLPMAMSAGAWNTTMATLTSPMDAKIDECKLRKLNPELYPCSSDGICKNRLEGYDCPCKLGMKGDGIKGTCTDKFPLVAQVIVGGIGGIFIIAAISFLILLRKEKQKTREFYQKNGGPTLEKAKFIKLFKKEELKPILKSSNFIGKGGFGEVYKGFLDNEEVAVKKPISGTMLENEHFANEVIIQSRVIHKNIVRLIGCCLEVDIPMLVYEFLSNGSLDDILHGKKKVALNLGVRLSIAVESADALVYMHSKTNAKIIHGDVKPANILLDDKFAPKISDFGISRLIARDKKHTGSVIGDMSYIDPVYLQTGLLTEKSDVYSFGVVILELISGQKATHSDGGSLVNSFLEAGKKEKKVTELFDKEIVAEGDLEILDSLAAIALECLNLDVDQRPLMTEVVERLLIMNRSRKS